MKLFITLLVLFCVQISFSQIENKTGDDNIRIEDQSPKSERSPDFFLTPLKIDTIHLGENATKYTAILSKQNGNFLNDTLGEVKLVVITSNNESYILHQYQDYQPAANEVVFLYQLVKEDFTEEQQTLFRLGEKIRLLLNTNYEDAGKIIAIISKKILKKERVPTVQVIFSLIKEKNK